MIGKDIEVAKKMLKKGMLVAIPTETVYGLAANALDERAVAEIFTVKQRPDFNPLIIHVSDITSIHDYVEEFPESLQRLAQQFMPGPLSLLLKKKSVIPFIVTAGSDYVAVRVPDHALTLNILRDLKFPLAAPSANPFGYISPTTAKHVEKQLGDKISYILDGGSCEVGIESTIVGIEGEDIIVYRKGGVAIEEIEKIVGPIILKEFSSSKPMTPGMLSSHYAPTKPLIIGDIDNLILEHKDKKFAIITFSSFNTAIDSDCQFVLSMTEDYSEAARNLFNILRTIDNMDIEVIFAELLPEVDLGRAINDRLKRAAFRQ